MQGRYPNIALYDSENDSYDWKAFYALGYRLFVQDFFGVHCPWSWERAKQERLKAMRIYLRERGLYHDYLGHICADDCDEFLKQEAIARYTYVARSFYWFTGIVNLIFAPIVGVVAIFCASLLVLSWISRGFFKKLKKMSA